MFNPSSRRLTSLVAAVAALALPTLASANLFYDASIQVGAQGFGNAPRALTLQATGQATVESGCVSVNSSGAIAFGDCISNASVTDGNGIANASGTTAMPSPLFDNQKYGIPTIGSLGITQASQLGILFNATEPAGNFIDVLDLTVKFYTSAGGFLGAIDGSHYFADSNPGNGVAGFTFRVSDDELAFVDGWFGTGGAGTRMALESTLGAGSFAGGPETFAIYNLNTPPIPEPNTYALILAGLGAVGFMARRRRKV